ncbi:CDP-glycerol glycerophosphotransferase family protein [Serratia sp. P2ACOL2]|uniref:CDP-glycerol glycerophosphotransferase family protein n=1 Tax=Serratia sp. P2ACOL2 TaxID=2482769 RepID=UPI000EFA8693|nr:CDP-glycerol glycerophosphotransferase family protein [Serratia sp. P2ACOL2]AYO37371.1 hypothetical protein EBA31_08725 [Serratia sp. P2ACOL2]
MNKIATYLLAPFFKRFEAALHHSNDMIVDLDEKIHTLKNDILSENKKNRELLSQLFDETKNSSNESKKTADNLNKINELLIGLSEKLEIAIPENNHSLLEMKDNINKKILHINKTLNIISKKQNHRNKTPTVLFLIHNMNTWYSVANIYYALSADPYLNVIIASIPRSFPGVDGYTGETETSNSLAKIGVNHMRVSTSNDKDIATILTTLAPDVIFRQSPWDNDIPDGFSAEKINFAKICYIPYYAINIVKNMSSGTDFDFQSNQALHNNSWRIYCDTEYAYQELCRNSLLNGINARYFGHPKLDFIHTQMIEYSKEKTNHKEVNILWAPHHSIDDGWLSFGTFDVNYFDFLTFAEENPKINIMLRPHPALFDYMKAKSEETKNKVEEFIARWNSLDNTSIDYNHDYIDSFKWSDIMVTDGISFLVEYPLFHKPIIFLENKNHAEFNEIGIIAVNCSHIAKDFIDVKNIVNKFENGTLEKKQTAIDSLEEITLPNKGNVHNLIAKDIKTNL